MRLITLQNNKLKKILDKRGAILIKAKKVTKEVDKLQKEQQKLGYKMEVLKEKTYPIIKKCGTNIELTEFEVISRVFNDNGVPTIEIVDQIEEYKTMVREKAKK